jgi:voltage-gated potassium channel
MAYRKKLRESIILLAITIIALLLCGTIIFHSLEGWSFVDSFYFVSMTATTVGYGDFTPTHTLSKIITVFYSLTIIPFILYSFTAIAKFEVDRVSHQMYGIKRKQEEQETEIEKTDRKLAENKRLLKEQQALIKKQERELKKQEKISLKQEVEIVGDQKKLKKAEKEIKEQSEELDVVEDIVEDQMVKKMK